jgi:hypothetical protein
LSTTTANQNNEQSKLMTVAATFEEPIDVEEEKT